MPKMPQQRPVALAQFGLGRGAGNVVSLKYIDCDHALSKTRGNKSVWIGLRLGTRVIQKVEQQALAAGLPTIRHRQTQLVKRIKQTLLGALQCRPTLSIVREIKVRDGAVELTRSAQVVF